MNRANGSRPPDQVALPLPLSGSSSPVGNHWKELSIEEANVLQSNMIWSMTQ